MLSWCSNNELVNKAAILVSISGTVALFPLLIRYEESAIKYLYTAIYSWFMLT